MDAVLDLTSRAVSFIILIQDTFLKSKQKKGVPSGQHTTDHVPVQFDNIFNDNFLAIFKDAINEVKKQEKQYFLNQYSKIYPTAINLGTDKILGQDFEMLEIKDSESEFRKRTEKLVWISQKQPDENAKEMAEDYAIHICNKLVKWVTVNKEYFKNRIGVSGVFDPPIIWRNAISDFIYEEADKRIELAQEIEYLPIHIVLALNGTMFDASQQRVLQWWMPEDQDENSAPQEKSWHTLLTKTEFNLHTTFKNNDGISFYLQRFFSEQTSSKGYCTAIKLMLGDVKTLRKQLINVKAPLTFDYVFDDELDEINRSRKCKEIEALTNNVGDETKGREENDPKNSRKKEENCNPFIKAENDPKNSRKKEENCNPFIKAENMNILALTFSGGGIRSATFNLGILQGFAEAGVLSKVDYLSTVSGGGYIGSWLAAWIKRQGSVKEVVDRLNTSKSDNPMAEEVRPVRWLRMFSNYFAPNKSIMSDDAWTIGVTWLRNMLLNQVIIFSIIFAALLAARLLFFIWLNHIQAKFDFTWYILACVILCLVSILTASGMQWYAGTSSKLSGVMHKKAVSAAHVILGFAFVGPLIVSAALYSTTYSTFWNALWSLKWGALTMFMCLLFVAIFGRYDRCLIPHKGRFWSYFSIGASSLVSAVIGSLLLTVLWKLAWFRNVLPDGHLSYLAFTFLPPLVSLSIGITVISRMALLGKYFPDERREWWGRIGGIVNKWSLIWIVFTSATCLGAYLLKSYKMHLNPFVLPTTIGGWIALVGGTVKAAFNGQSSGKEETKGVKSVTLEILSSVGPYLFILGLLIILPTLIDPLLDKIVSIHIGWLPSSKDSIRLLGLLTIIFGGIGFYLSRKLGVNEFSMHNFYRNRLVRAYLGATRSRDERAKTSNPFTGFDKFDDLKFSTFTNDNGYYGPYLIMNTTLNASEIYDLSRQDRKAESFIFSPLYCGFDFSGTRALSSAVLKSYDFGMRPTVHYAAPDGGTHIGTAMAISGAAVNPNQGYHSSAGTAFLLTVFNAQMGWWIGNPRKNKWQNSDPEWGLPYIFNNLTGRTSTKSEYLCLSDGGHFDNMGLYEMVRRRCRFIIVSDAEQDDKFTCEGFANAIRCCRIDFGAEIDINISKITNRDNSRSKEHYAVGVIRYSGDSTPNGILVYIKSSVTGDEAVDVTEYASKHKTFPHQTTADQFFDEQQFESYRKLGLHISKKITANAQLMRSLQICDKAGGVV
ncbi:MAG: patatin-like phospholipase family protein [Ferruginibacter sp.]